MERIDVTSSARLAGQVERYHTWPVLRRQSIGEHTWQMLRIYWQIFGPLPPEVSTYIIWHDAGELATGDLPFPVKSRNPVLKTALDDLEVAALEAMGGPLRHNLFVYDSYRRRIKVCDLLEMWEYGRHELSLGNTFAQPIVDDTLALARKLLLEGSPDDAEKVEAYVGATGTIELGRKPWKSSAAAT